MLFVVLLVSISCFLAHTGALFMIPYCTSNNLIVITLDANTASRQKRQLIAFCSDNSVAVAACNQGRCGTGYTCDTVTGLCCATRFIGAVATCADNTPVVARCINGRCGATFTCQNGTYCCRSSTPISSTCVAPNTILGPCINNLCPVNSRCLNGNCCGIA